MRTLKIVCIVCFVFWMFSAVTGIQINNASPPGTVIAKFSDWLAITKLTVINRLGCLLAAIISAAAFYGIHRRLSIMWKFGWLILILGYLNFVISAVSATSKNYKLATMADWWVGFIMLLVVSAPVVWYWGRVWYRQKPYFNSSQWSSH
jgi:hypothetical protein